jgi:NTE family protein
MPSLGEPELGKHQVRRALVLCGGGARGAYEAGVLRYVYGPLAARLGFMPKIDIYTGSSVGAVNVCYLAAHADDPAAGIAGLTQIWERMAFSRVYSFGMGDAMNFARTAFGALTGRGRVHPTRHPKRLHGLLNTKPLEELVIRAIPWRRMRRNLHSGHFESLCVYATEIATGRTVNFVYNREHKIASWTRDSSNVALPARVGPAHTLASAAIPLLFPSVRVGDQYYVDGGLRQATPLTPALRLGANRLLIVGLRDPKITPLEPLAIDRVRKFRTLGFLVGKMLNAVLSDRLEADVAHMRVLNRLLKAGLETYGDDHIDRINPFVTDERGHGFQLVMDSFIRPSEDIGVIAADHVRRIRREPPGSIIGDIAFRSLTRGDPAGEADLMSYLLFDGRYAKDLIDLGERDAARQEESLARLFME